MANQRVVQLVMLLYDVCKDVLIHFFKTRCLNDNLTDMTLKSYVQEHKSKLCLHFLKSNCHMCDTSDISSTCIDFTSDAFYCFFTTKTGSGRTERDQIVLKEHDLQVWNLQYLLLAGDLKNEEHKLIVGLYKQRKSVSKELILHVSFDESRFNEIWETSKNYLLDIYRSLNDTAGTTMLSHRIDYLKMSNPIESYARDFWYNLQAEFGNKVRQNTFTLCTQSSYSLNLIFK